MRRCFSLASSPFLSFEVYRFQREREKRDIFLPAASTSCARSVAFPRLGQSHCDCSLPRGTRAKRTERHRRGKPNGSVSSSSIGHLFHRLSLALSLFAAIDDFSRAVLPQTQPPPPLPGPRLGRAAQGRRRRRPQQGQAGPRRRRPRARRRRHGDAGLCRRLGPHAVLAVEAVRVAPEEGGQGPPEEAEAGALERDGNWAGGREWERETINFIS